MKNPKYTPGPWTIKPSILEDYSFIQIGTDQIDVKTEANARLIAAAPELLEALEILLSRPNDYLLSEDRQMIESAIRKAKGE